MPLFRYLPILLLGVLFSCSSNSSGDGPNPNGTAAKAAPDTAAVRKAA